MTVVAPLAHLEPLPSALEARVHPNEAADWPARLREIRTCYWCKSVYPEAGYAWRCEHWHEALA